MSALMDNLEFARVYIKNLFVITSGSFEEHLDKAEEIMKWLHLAGIKCKIDKCKFALSKVE